MDHCIAFFRRKNERRLFEIYVTDALKAIAENTSKMYGGSSMKMRYADLMMDTKTEEESERTADDIINSIKNKINNLGG